MIKWPVWIADDGDVWKESEWFTLTTSYILVPIYGDLNPITGARDLEYKKYRLRHYAAPSPYCYEHVLRLASESAHMLKEGEQKCQST